MEPADTSPSAEYAAQWAAVREKIRALDEEGLGDDAQRLVQDLETAYEELRVADEEVRVQEDQIAQLVEGQHLLRWQHERMMAVLPVPVVMTDELGIIRSVNAAAAALIRMRVGRLVGKPVFALFAVDDRSDLRRLLVRLGGETGGFRRVVSVIGRPDRPISADLSVTRLPGAEAEISWMMLVGSATARPGGHDGRALPDALARLALIPTSVSEDHEALRRAAQISRECLGPGLSVSLSIGSPHEPAALASTSQVAQAFDGAMLAAGEGPCMSAFQGAMLVESRDLHRDPRWPRLSEFAPVAVRGVVSAPLEVGDELVGTFNVYTGEEVWPERLREDVELLAGTVAAVLFELGLKRELRQLASDFQAALTSRATIDQAKGIVMADQGVDAEAAFAHLAHLSSTRHLKLRAVAQEIVDGASSPKRRR